MKRREFVYQAGLSTVALAVGCRALEGQLIVSPQPNPLPDTGSARGPLDTGSQATDSGVAAPPDSGPRRCEPTDGDIQGPYYREGIPIRDNLDLYGDEGEGFILAGTVTDEACEPIANAVVEIWQANPSGDYDTSSPEKRYYAQLATDGAGAFAFTTLMPGRYLNGATYRPAHIHMKVWAGNSLKLTTQIYFAGDPFNPSDPWYDPAREVSPTEGVARLQVVV